MNIIMDGRRTGKTTRLIQLSAELDYYIVTRNHETAWHITEMAKNMGLYIPFPLTYDEFLRKRYYPKGVRGLLVDDADELIQYLATVPIHTIVVNTTSHLDIPSPPMP